MKRFIKIAAVTLALSLVFIITVSAATSLKPTNFFVNDYASVITDDDEVKIFKQGENLYNACKAQVAVVTIDSLNGEPIEDFAYNLANEWGLGDKNEDNGVLILLAAVDREIRIEVGSGLEGALPDSKTGRIIDKYGMDYFAEDNFSAGLASVYNSVVNEIYIEYDLEPDKDYKPVGNSSAIFEIIFMVIIILLLILGRFRGGRGGIFFFPFFMPRGGHYGGYGSGGGFGSGGFSGGGGGFSGGGASRKF